MTTSIDVSRMVSIIRVNYRVWICDIGNALPSCSGFFCSSFCYCSVDVFFQMVPDCSDELIDCLLLNKKVIHCKNNFCGSHKLIDILHKQVLLALSVVKTLSMQNNVSARKFLEVAKDTGNDILFYETFKYFENRNYTLRGSKSFLSGNIYASFIKVCV